jgi:hypothetical protein
MYLVMPYSSANSTPDRKSAGRGNPVSVRPSHNRITALPHFPLPRCHIAALPHCRIAALPHCRIAALPHCCIAALPHCRIAALLHFL